MKIKVLEYHDLYHGPRIKQIVLSKKEISEAEKTAIEGSYERIIEGDLLGLLGLDVSDVRLVIVDEDPQKIFEKIQEPSNFKECCFLNKQGKLQIFETL